MGGMIVSGLGSLAVATMLVRVFCLHKPGTVAYKAIWLMLVVFTLSPLVSLIANDSMRWQSTWLSLVIVNGAIMCVWRRVRLHLFMARSFTSGHQSSQDAARFVWNLRLMMRSYKKVSIVLRSVDERTISVEIDQIVLGNLQFDRAATAVLSLLQSRCNGRHSSTGVRSISELAINSGQYGLCIKMTTNLES